jgi:hypothetical protein
MGIKQSKLLRKIATANSIGSLGTKVKSVIREINKQTNRVNVSLWYCSVALWKQQTISTTKLGNATKHNIVIIGTADNHFSSNKMGT